MDRNTRTELSQLLATVVTENKKKLIEAALENRTRYLTVVLENIQKPHNASAVLRTVECLGLQDFYFIEQDREYEANPGIVKGAIKWVDVYRYGEKGVNNTTACLEALKAKGYAVAVTSPHTEGYYPEQLPINRPVALVLGNEQEGVSETALASADYHLRIPMWGFTESYNLSVSAALCTYTIMQRIRHSENKWRLSEEEADELRLQWYRTLVKRASVIESEFWRNHDQGPD